MTQLLFHDPSAFVSDPDFVLYVGDVRDVLATLPDESVDCCVTSPPYWGLRDYGTGEWLGGDPEHDHDTVGARSGRGGSGTLDKRSADAMPSRIPARACSCGAAYHDAQLGLEETPADFVAAMVAVFREVRRVLSPAGTLWLNIGDSYSHGGNGARDPERWPKQSRNDHRIEHRNTAGGKPKDLIGIPWRLAFGLQEDGWYLRSDIIWSKTNPMPESVTDRPTKAHEYLFLLTKSPRYFYDADAIREPLAEKTYTTFGSKHRAQGNDPLGMVKSDNWGKSIDERQPKLTPAGEIAGANKRSVWEIAIASYPEAHFATFPQALVEPCVKAGCPAGGIVLDPFMGSGTTALVARKLGRRAVGIELNPEYAGLCATRLSQLSLLAEPAA